MNLTQYPTLEKFSNLSNILFFMAIFVTSNPVLLKTKQIMYNDSKHSDTSGPENNNMPLLGIP